MRHNQNYNKNVRWLENVKRRTRAFGFRSTAFDGQKNGVPNDNIYANKARLKKEEEQRQSKCVN